MKFGHSWRTENGGGRRAPDREEDQVRVRVRADFKVRVRVGVWGRFMVIGCVRDSCSWIRVMVRVRIRVSSTLGFGLGKILGLGLGFGLGGCFSGKRGCEERGRDKGQGTRDK